MNILCEIVFEWEGRNQLGKLMIQFAWTHLVLSLCLFCFIAVLTSDLLNPLVRLELLRILLDCPTPPQGTPRPMGTPRPLFHGPRGDAEEF